MADNKWYASKRGQITGLIAAVCWVLDHWGRVETAVGIYQKAPGWFLLVSPYIAPVLFVIALVFFEIRRRSGPSPRAPKKPVEGMRINWRLTSYVTIIIVIVVASVWAITRPNLTATIKASAIGDYRDVYPAASIVLNVQLWNVGPPTTINDWTATVTLQDGEIATGKFMEGGMTLYADTGRGTGNEPVFREFESDQLLSRKTAEVPIRTGGFEAGPVAFIFPGYMRNHINTPGNLVTLGFKDAKHKQYSAEYVIRAKSLFFMQSH